MEASLRTRDSAFFEEKLLTKEHGATSDWCSAWSITRLTVMEVEQLVILTFVRFALWPSAPISLILC
jgi:hypothetical protein